MSAWLLSLLLFGKPMVADPALHKIDVHIAGPLAMVEVWRTLEANVRTANDRQVGGVVDLALPEGAALLDWEIIEGRAVTRLTPQSEVEANAALAAGLKLRRLSPPTPIEEGTDLRVHVTPIADGERAILHFRYSALAGCRNGRLVLRVPESLEENPAAAAEVTVTLDPLPDRTPLATLSLAGKAEEMPGRGRPAIWRAMVPPRPAWEIGWSYGKATEPLPGTAVAAAVQVPRVLGAGGKARAVPQYELAGLLCRSDGEAKPPALDRVVLVVDRSRSVGPGGLSAERRLARAVIEALPPSIPFAAVLFGATTEPVFRLPRLPTREALDGFTGAADPNHLQNGTDVVAALTRARALLGGGGQAERAWVVLVTDGALPSSQTSERMQDALAGKGGPDPKVLVLLTRQHGDEAVPASAVAEYARFARRFGGLVRVVDPASPGEVARDLVATMGKGGDLLEVRLEDGKLTDALAPGQGASLVLTSPARLPRDKRVRIQARGLDSDLRAELIPVPVKREWMAPLFEGGAGKRRAWAGATSGMAVAVLPGPAPVKPAEGIVRGRMDPVVLRNSLALAFTPRARACYVSRRVAEAKDAFLRGRLKLELNLERGELEDAVVRQSTLDNPAIEDCVRRAAWAVEYPRPEHRDAPTVANLNLVFAPRTPREVPPDASAADREIELIVGPVTFPEDYQDLLAPPPSDKSPKP
jgi:hypothetical protein